MLLDFYATPDVARACKSNAEIARHLPEELLSGKSATDHPYMVNIINSIADNSLQELHSLALRELSAIQKEQAAILLKVRAKLFDEATHLEPLDHHRLS